MYSANFKFNFSDLGKDSIQYASIFKAYQPGIKIILQMCFI